MDLFHGVGRIILYLVQLIYITSLRLSNLTVKITRSQNNVIETLKRCHKLRKRPSSVCIVFSSKNKDLDLSKVSRILDWISACGIKEISLYDSHGNAFSI